MAATAVNAPMMPAEVLKELQPFVTLASGLGRAAVQLVRRRRGWSLDPARALHICICVSNSLNCCRPV